MSNYKNYQLYRTNPKLSGQLAWDIVVGRNNSDLGIEDFRLAPISPAVPYNKYVQDNLLMYPHQENLVRFYKQVANSFYKDLTDPMLMNPWPLISDNNKFYDTHDGTYEMGARRISYQLYQKQISFLVPLWLEKVDKNIKFEITVYSHQTKVGKPLCQKVLTILGNENDKFSTYLQNYLEYVGIYGTGNNQCMYIDFKRKISYINGLNVKTGLVQNKDISGLVPNLLNREKPLLEFNNMIINQFENNFLCTPHLFNFRLCFNLDDIVPQFFLNDFLGSRLNIQVRTIVDGCELDICDFYTNFEFIPRKNCTPITFDGDNGMVVPDTSLNDSDQNMNVLSYLGDNNYIDLIDKNKITQNNIHWSLVGNNDYLLNLYNGFSGFMKDGDNMINIHHSYDGAPNILPSIYNKTANNVGWACHVHINNPSEFYYLAKHIDSLYERASDFSQQWVNNLKYNESELQSDTPAPKVVTVWFNEENGTLPEIGDKFLPLPSNENDENQVYMLLWSSSLYWANRDSVQPLIVLVSQSRDELVFSNMKKTLSNIKFDETDYDYKLIISNNWLSRAGFESVEEFLEEASHKLQQLGGIMGTVDESSNPPIITPMESLIYDRANGPSISGGEVRYIKSKARGSYVLRYSGMIRPTFILPESNDINFNYLYYKDIILKDDYPKSVYNKFGTTGFLPKYPSMGYFPMRKQKMNYNKLELSFSHEKMFNICNCIEYPYYNHGVSMMILPELKFDMNIDSTSPNVDPLELKSIIDSEISLYLKSKYGINDNDKSFIDYVLSLYKVEYEFTEMISQEDKFTFQYEVKLKLQ